MVSMNARLNIALAGCAVLLGCGGSGHALFNTGNIHVLVNWPDQGRAMPSYAESVRVRLESWSGPDIVEVSSRTTSSPHRTEVHFRNITRKSTFGYPNYFVHVWAFSGKHATGQVVATRVYAVNFDPEQNNEALYNIDLLVAESITPEVDRLRINGPFQLSADVPHVLSGDALTRDNKVLLMPNKALRWRLVNGAAHATVSESGLLTPSGTPGTVRVRLSEVDSAVPSVEADFRIVAPAAMP